MVPHSKADTGRYAPEANCDPRTGEGTPTEEGLAALDPIKVGRRRTVFKRWSFSPAALGRAALGAGVVGALLGATAALAALWLLYEFLDRRGVGVPDAFFWRPTLIPAPEIRPGVWLPATKPHHITRVVSAEPSADFTQVAVTCGDGSTRSLARVRLTARGRVVPSVLGSFVRPCMKIDRRTRRYRQHTYRARAGDPRRSFAR